MNIQVKNAFLCAVKKNAAKSKKITFCVIAVQLNFKTDYLKNIVYKMQLMACGRLRD